MNQDTFNEMSNLLSEYEYELPLVVAEYFFYIYNKKIQTQIQINGKFFKILSPYRKQFFFAFNEDPFIIEHIGFNFY